MSARGHELPRHLAERAAVTPPKAAAPSISPTLLAHDGRFYKIAVAERVIYPDPSRRRFQVVDHLIGPQGRQRGPGSISIAPFILIASQLTQQSKRFIETAEKVGADDEEALERAFKKIGPNRSRDKDSGPSREEP